MACLELLQLLGGRALSVSVLIRTGRSELDVCHDEIGHGKTVVCPRCFLNTQKGPQSRHFTKITSRKTSARINFISVPPKDALFPFKSPFENFRFLSFNCKAGVLPLHIVLCYTGLGLRSPSCCTLCQLKKDGHCCQS